MSPAPTKAVFFGSCTALVTPFKGGQLDKDAFCKLVDWQIENGTA
ncbi:MAG: 4-hydroxy-tetrahydrodipicolinate synthase, partial [Alphaproteobacteria bacterium]|nr:4-hydroxy-tetrahydrodipicolinate synthase [Alphaproteobacteria bacterium]